MMSILFFIITLCVYTARLIYTLKFISCQIEEYNSNMFLPAFHTFSCISQAYSYFVDHSAVERVLRREKKNDENPVSDSEHDLF